MNPNPKALYNKNHTTLLALVNLKIKLAVKQLDNPLSVKSLKREIARAKTVLRDKKLGAKPGEKLNEKK